MTQQSIPLLVVVLMAVATLVAAVEEATNGPKELDLFRRMRDLKYFVFWTSNWVNYLKWLWIVVIILGARVSFCLPFIFFSDSGKPRN